MTHRFSIGVRLLLSLAILLSAGLAGNAPALHAATPLPTATPRAAAAKGVPTYAQAKKELDDSFKQVAALRSLVDRTQFDVSDLGFALGGDADAIVNFVRSEIAFEQYPGYLRGAQGALMSRAGNALDQSVLLQRLMLDAGYEAKILHGTLDADAALALVQQMFVPRKAPLPFSQQMDKVRTLVKKMIATSGLGKVEMAELETLIVEPPPIISTVAFSNTLADAGYLQELLAQAGVELGDPDIQARLVEEAKDYFWVEYRLGPSEKWQPVHPAFGSAPAPTNLTASETFDDESQIPESLQQRFQMQVVIEHKVGDQIETLPLFAPLTGVTANMIGRPHTFAIVPDGYTDAADFADQISALKKSRMFFPALDGELVGGAMFFDLLGNLIPPDAAQSPLAGLITGMSASLGGAIDALESAGDASAENADSGYFLLTGVYVDYTFSAPGQEPQIFRRTLVDRIGAKNRAAGLWQLRNADDPLPDLIELTAKYTLMLAPSAVPQAYMADAQLKHLLDLKPFFDFALGNQYKRPGFEIISSSKLDNFDFTWPGHPVIFNVFDAGAAAIGAVNYRPTPSLVIYKEQQNGKITSAWTDVVNNQRRAYTLNRDGVSVDSAALLTTGVWETRTEGVALDTHPTTEENVFTVFNKAAQAKIAPRVLTPADVTALTTMKLPSDALPQLEADLNAGYVLILPETTPKGVNEFGWWRIDPLTGQTLGVNQNGLGAASIEYAVLLRSVAFAAGCGLIAYHDTNGLTVQDAIVCASVGAGAYGTMAATLGVSAKIVVAAAAMVGTGAWLNNSPGLQHPIIRR